MTLHDTTRKKTWYCSGFLKAERKRAYICLSIQILFFNVLVSFTCTVMSCDSIIYISVLFLGGCNGRKWLEVGAWRCL